MQTFIPPSELILTKLLTKLPLKLLNVPANNILPVVCILISLIVPFTSEVSVLLMNVVGVINDVSPGSPLCLGR